MSLINTPSCSQTHDKFRMLSINILKRYSSIEDSDYNNKMYYYTDSADLADSVDDILTKFDKLSNEFNIGVVSRLNHVQASVVLLLFKALFDNNYWIYDKNAGSFLFEDLELSESNLSNLYVEYDVNMWSDVLERYISKQFDEINVIDDNTSIFGLTYISGCSPSKKDDHQYMSINNIINKYQ